MSATLVVVPAPVVKIAGKQYSVRYGHGALYSLSAWGIDLTTIMQTLSDALGRAADGDTPAVLPNGRRVEIMTKIAAASLGTVDMNGDWRSAQITPEDLTVILDRATDEEAAELDRVTWEVFAKKIGLPLTPKPIAAAAQNPDPSDTPANGGSTTGPSEPEPSV